MGYLMPKHEYEKFVKLHMAILDKCAKRAEDVVGKGPEMNGNDWRVMRVASSLVIETAVSEIEDQCRLVVAKVLSLNELSSACSVIRSLTSTATELFSNLVDDALKSGEEIPKETIARAGRNVLRLLKAVDDLIDTGAQYRGDVGNHKYFITENAEAREAFTKVIKAVTKSKNKLQAADSALAHELSLVAARVGRAIMKSHSVDNFTSLDDVELEK